MKVIQFLLFFSTFLAIYGSMNAYVYWRLSGLLGLRRSIWILALLAVAFPLMSILVHYSQNIIMRIFYALSSIYSGVVWIGFSVLLVYEVAKYLIKLEPRVYGMIVLAVILVLTIGSIINGFLVHVRTIEVPIAGLETEVNAVQMSDIHIGTMRNSGFLNKLIEKTNDLEPDVIFITGDLVDGGGEYSHKSYNQLANLKAKTFFITGNHETYVGMDEVMHALKGSGMHMLRDEVTEYQGLQIVGLDDPGNNRTVNNVEFDADKPTILLRHQPYLDKLEGVDLQLSGHTHAGQIWPFNLLVRTAFRYQRGLHEIGGSYLYISPGTGTWGPPMRLGSRNEITLIRLVPA